jgi:hypothetical protein
MKLWLRFGVYFSFFRTKSYFNKKFSEILLATFRPGLDNPNWSVGRIKKIRKKINILGSILKKTEENHTKY